MVAECRCPQHACVTYRPAAALVGIQRVRTVAADERPLCPATGDVSGDSLWKPFAGTLADGPSPPGSGTIPATRSLGGI